MNSSIAISLIGTILILIEIYSSGLAKRIEGGLIKLPEKLLGLTSSTGNFLVGHYIKVYVVICAILIIGTFVMTLGYGDNILYYGITALGLGCCWDLKPNRTKSYYKARSPALAE